MAAVSLPSSSSASHAQVNTADNYGSAIGRDNNGYIHRRLVLHRIHTAKPPALVCCSRPRNPSFLGRHAELSQIEQHHSTNASAVDRRAAGARPDTVVIQGLGGTGKSELCLHYLAIRSDQYWAIFWIDGTSASSLQSGYAKIAKQLGLASDSPRDVSHDLASREQSWLLVVDNVDDPGLDIASYLPDLGTGHVLVTTRNPDLKAFGKRLFIQLASLAEAGARTLLLKTANTPANERGSMQTVADAILQTLDFHTLAIIQAGAFIRECCDLVDYLPLYKQQRRQLLSYGITQAQSQYGNVYATFEVSALKLQENTEDEQQQRSGADALHLLQLFAFMHTRGPFALIFSDAREFAAHCSQAASSSEDSPGARHDSPRPSSSLTSGSQQISYTECPSESVYNINDDEAIGQRCSHLLTPVAYMGNDLAGKMRWRRACARLHKFSMLSFDTDADGHETLSFHPLILAWALDRQSPQDRRKSWFSAATALCLSSRGEISYGPLLDRLAPHSRSCAALVSTEWWKEISSAPYLVLLYQLSCLLVPNRDDAEDAKVCECIELCLKVTGKDSPLSSRERAYIDLVLGMQAINAGNLTKAVHLLERVVDAQSQTLEETHSHLLDSQHALAVAYKSNGQVKEAVQILEHVVEVQQKSLVETHLRRLASQHDSAAAYHSNGQVKEAVQLLEHVVRVKEQTLVETHLRRLISQHELARFYHSNGQVEEAIQLLEHVVRVKEQTLVETHPHRLLSEQVLRQIKDSTQNG